MHFRFVLHLVHSNIFTILFSKFLDRLFDLVGLGNNGKYQNSFLVFPEISRHMHNFHAANTFSCSSNLLFTKCLACYFDSFSIAKC